MESFHVNQREPDFILVRSISKLPTECISAQFQSLNTLIPGSKTFRLQKIHNSSSH